MIIALADSAGDRRTSGKLALIPASPAGSCPSALAAGTLACFVLLQRGLGHVAGFPSDAARRVHDV